MTVPATPRRAGPFNGNGVTTSFPFSFKTFDEVDIAVVFVDADGLESSLVLNSDYSVTLNPDQEVAPGGAVTYPVSGTPLAPGETLSIVGALPYDQVTDLPTGGSYRAQVQENAFDRMVMQIQQLAEIADRTLTLPASVDPDDVSAQLPAPESLKLIGWNEPATGLQNFDPSTLATIVAFGTAKAELFSGDGVETVFVLTANPGVQANLDVAVDGITQRPGVDFVWSAGTTITFTSPPGAGTDNILVRYQQGLPTEDSALRIDLADGTDTTLGDALLAVKADAAGAVATTQHGVNERTRSVFDWLTFAQQLEVLSGIPVSDISVPVNAAIAATSGVAALEWPAGVYRGNFTIPNTGRFDWRGAGSRKTVLQSHTLASPAVTNLYQAPDWCFSAISDIGFISRTAHPGPYTGTGFCFGDPTVYAANAELGGRVSFKRVTFEGLDKGVMKPWGNIGNLFDSCTFLKNNYGLWARGAQVGFGGAGMMHCGNDTYINTEFNDNKKAARLYMDTTPGWGGVVDAGGVVIQFNQGFGSVFDLNLPSFTAYTAIQEQNTWYESNGLAGVVTIDTLAGPTALTAVSRRLTNDSAKLNFTCYGRTIGIGSDAEVASINVCSSNRPVMDIICDYAANISRTNLIRAVERVGGAVLASIGFLAQSATETVLQLANGTAGLVRLRKDGGFVVGPSNASATNVHRIGGVNGIGGGALFLEVAGFGGAPTFNAYVADSDNSNVAQAAVKVGRVTATGRSINAGGTVNASGADYAEYMTKAAGCADIPKGAVAGVDSDGLLTDKWADAVTFVVKSTDPCLVGADTWGIGLEGDALEAARQKVDRIAFAGRVPVNVIGAQPGDYIVPAADGVGITGICVSNPTFEQYRISIGRTIAIEEDGRARVLIKVS